MQRLEMAVTEGCSLRLSLMHMVLKGICARSSLPEEKANGGHLRWHRMGTPPRAPSHHWISFKLLPLRSSWTSWRQRRWCWGCCARL